MIIYWTGVTLLHSSEFVLTVSVVSERCLLIGVLLVAEERAFMVVLKDFLIVKEVGVLC